MGFAFDGRNRLETGVDGLLELRDPQTGQTLAQWIGAQVKTTDKGAYVHEDDDGFEYLLKPDDLAYWRGSNIPVILVLVRLSDNSMFWKPVARIRVRRARQCSWGSRCRFFSAGNSCHRPAVFPQNRSTSGDRSALRAYTAARHTGFFGSASARAEELARPEYLNASNSRNASLQRPGMNFATISQAQGKWLSRSICKIPSFATC